MKIHLGSCERASVFLAVVFATLVIVFGMIVCRYLQKWAKRIDTGEPYPLPGCNSNDVTIPNPSNPNITGGRIEDYHRNYMQYVPSNAFVTPPHPLISTNTIILISYLDTNLVLQIQRQTNGPAQRLTDADIGIPVDQYGVPTNFRWSTGFVPTGGKSCLIQRSTNCLDWEPVSTVTIADGYTNALILDETSEKMFYRGVEQ